VATTAAVAVVAVAEAVEVPVPMVTVAAGLASGKHSQITIFERH
jgi:hypothetical protein